VKNLNRVFRDPLDYYVVGIGRSKRTSESGSDIEILEEQKYDPNPLSVK
jgi:hypothetical protein